MTIESFHALVEKRCKEKKISARKASLDASGNADFIRKLKTAKNVPKADKLFRLAKVLEISNDEIIKHIPQVGTFSFDSGRDRMVTEMSFPKKSQISGAYGLLRVPEYNIEASAGDGSELPDTQNICREWVIPREAIAVYCSSPENVRLIKVRGDSMEPGYRSGECVMIDIADNKPTSDGVYVLWNGLGLVLKHIQIIPDPKGLPMLRISSENPHYGPYNMPYSEAIIHGRVIAKWEGK